MHARPLISSVTDPGAVDPDLDPTFKENPDPDSADKKKSDPTL